MLVNAMEVCGIEGTFKSTCEGVMRVLRENKDSVMAMLEAFVHDPLINWRLLETTAEEEQVAASNKASIGNPNEIQQTQNDFGVVDELSQYGSVDDRGRHPSRSVKERELKKSLRTEMDLVDEELQPEALNKRALAVINRINKKLTGRDFESEDSSEDEAISNVHVVQKPLDYSDQVQLLIEQATSHANLCQCYIGWCAFW
ncbi:FATC domain protein [compost metagenome]